MHCDCLEIQKNVSFRIKISQFSFKNKMGALLVFSVSLVGGIVGIMYGVFSRSTMREADIGYLLFVRPGIYGTIGFFIGYAIAMTGSFLLYMHSFYH